MFFFFGFAPSVYSTFTLRLSMYFSKRFLEFEQQRINVDVVEARRQNHECVNNSD